MKGLSSLGALVYSTDGGRMCPECRQPVAQCLCKQAALAAAVPPAGSAVRVRREVKGRGGKAVTVVQGVPLDATALAELGKQLKSACGSGGTVKDGTIEVQGDHVDRVLGLLKERGYTARRAGG